MTASCTSTLDCGANSAVGLGLGSRVRVRFRVRIKFRVIFLCVNTAVVWVSIGITDP